MIRHGHHGERRLPANHERNPVGNQCLSGGASSIHSIDNDGPLARGEAHDSFQPGRLTGAVGAQQGKHLTPLD